MADTVTPEQRRRIMAAVKGKDTKPEMLVRRFLHAAGFRYRLHDRKLPGCPDLVFPSLHTVVFIHGCFWHGHENCKYARLPKSNVDFWRSKILRNSERDSRVRIELEKQSWNVIVIWECDLRNKSHREETLEKVAKELLSIRNHTYSQQCYPYDLAAEPETHYGK